MSVNREHLSGLEMARSIIEENWPAEALLEIVDSCIAEAKSAPEPVRKDYAALEQECKGLKAQHARDSAELRSLCQARDDARRERDAALLQVEAALAVFPFRADGQVFNVNGQKITADGDERFYSAKRVDEFLVAVHAALQAKP